MVLASSRGNDWPSVILLPMSCSPLCRALSHQALAIGIGGPMARRAWPPFLYSWDCSRTGSLRERTATRRRPCSSSSLAVQIAKADGRLDEAFELLLGGKGLGYRKALHHRRSGRYTLPPSVQRGLVVNPQHLAHLMVDGHPEPWKHRDVGDRVFVADEIGLALQPRFQHREDSIHLLDIAAGHLRIFVLPGAGEDHELTEHRPERGHLEHDHLN